MPTIAADSGLSATDLFCGAGGSSIGLHRSGIRVELACNHSPVAIRSHQLNFPGTQHDIADISQVDPRRYPRTSLLWGSPECTNHSPARSVSPTAQRDVIPGQRGHRGPVDSAARSRATAWDIVRFSEYHLYDAVIVENVVELGKWVLYRAWLDAMVALGYDYQELSLNSAHAQPGMLGAPQLRDRLYVVFTRRGLPRPDLEPYPLATCHRCSTVVRAVRRWKVDGRTVGRYGRRNQYLFSCPDCANDVEPLVRPAHEALDLTLRGERVGARTTLLTEKTLIRIQAGLDRHCSPAARERAREAGLPAGFVMRNNGSRGTGVEHTTPFTEPLRTLTTSAHQSVVLAGDTNRAEDAWVRMFTPTETKAGMAIPHDYRVEGTVTDQLCQLGNAVTPPAAQHVASAVVEALTGRRFDLLAAA